MKKIYLSLTFLSSFFLSSQAYANPIIIMGIKSKLNNYILSNCRIGSTLKYNQTAKSLTTSLDKTLYQGQTSGKRTSANALPDSKWASKMEFKSSTIIDIFGENFNYTLKNNSKYSATLTKTAFAVVPMITAPYDVGMTLASRLPAGLNASSIYRNGEINMSYRMDADTGQLECDIYHQDGGLIGLVDYITFSSNPAQYSTLAYGDTDPDIENNDNILKSLRLSSKTVYDFGHSYPKKRFLLTISNDYTESDSEESAKTPTKPILGSSGQATINNDTDDYTFKNCSKSDTHGSWDSYPDESKSYGPHEHFEFSMHSKGNGIQGQIDCEVYYSKSQTNSESYQVARLLLEMNNGGTAIALFPYVNDEATSNKLVAAKYQYRLYAQNVENNPYSYNIHQ